MHRGTTYIQKHGQQDEKREIKEKMRRDCKKASDWKEKSLAKNDYSVF